MNRKEDYIEDLFRNNEHLLEEKPPRRAWSKLEEKLDLEKAQSTRRIYRYISTAAAVIAIVAMVSAIALFQNDAFNENKTVAMTEEITPNQEFSVNDNASDWRKEYAPEEVETEATIATEPESVTETQPKIEAEKIAMNKEEVDKKELVKPTQPQPKPKPSTTTKPTIVVANEPIETEVVPVSALEKPATAKAKEGFSNTAIDEAVIATKQTSTLDNVQISNASEPALDGKIARIEPATELSNAMPQSTYSGDYENLATTKSKKIKSKKPVISDFNWLLGSWKNATINGLSYEKWEITDKNTLTANGYLIQGNDTVFVEKMELKQIRNKVYYIANLNGSKTALKFQLKSLENNVATFENTKNTFPKAVILTRDGNNNFIISYEEEMNELQEKQLRYRNNISNARASRRMSRARN